MYSSEIVQRRLFQAKKDGIPFNRVPRDEAMDIAARLQKLIYDDRGSLLPAGQLARPLDSKELAFTASERLICKSDFSYYVQRYHMIERDAGVSVDEGVGASKLLESQQRLLKTIGKREDQVHAEHKQYGHTEGIRVYAHKCRQVAFTSLSRALSIHRMLFWPGTRAFAGALNPDGVGELYKRDKLAIDNLPFWLKPEIYPDVKDSEIGFPAPLNSRLLYQAENQKAGIGVGTQQDVSHLTEVSLWNFPHQIGFSFAPALPKSRMTLHIQEATSFGKGGYWQTVTEACRNRLRGYESWSYVFIPWWTNRNKYRSIPPFDWKPEPHTIEHAELIARTSPEWNEGVTYMVARDQLYWWETERAKYARDDKLASFLSSYPATPEMSFVNWSQGAIPVELIEEMELQVRTPLLYSVDICQ